MPQTPDDWDWSQMQSRSAALFRSQHRLPVAILVATAEPEQLYAAGISRRYADKGTELIDRKEAGRQLEALWKARLLSRATDSKRKTRDPGRPPDLFIRLDDPAWEALLALGERFRRPPRTSARGTRGSSSKG
jgi:hypothetical protein